MAKGMNVTINYPATSGGMAFAKPVLAAGAIELPHHLGETCALACNMGLNKSDSAGGCGFETQA